MGNKRNAEILDWLGKQSYFVEATKTEVGQELFVGMLNDMQRLLVKIIEEKATPEELAEFRVLKRLNKEWSDKINKFNAELTKYKQLETNNE